MTRRGGALWISGVLAAFVVTVPSPREVFSARAPLAAITATLSPDSISGVRGQKRTLTATVDLGTTGKLLSSYGLTLQWDSTVVRLDSVGAGTFSMPIVNYVNGGEVRLTSVVANGVGGVPSLAQLYFRFVNDTAGKRTVIQPNFTELTSAVDFTDLRAISSSAGAVARILPPPVTVGFAPDSIRERVGFKPQIDLVADFDAAGNVSLGSYTATVTWDPAIMALDSVRAGSFAGLQTNPVSAGQMLLTAASANNTETAPSLARFFFRFVNPSFPTETALDVSLTEMHAAFTFADLLPGVTRRNGKALIGGVLRGDIDIGGSLAALDAQLILQGVVGLSLPAGATGVPNGDADCNGTLQARDAQIVLNSVVGNDVSQFCAGKIQ